MKLELQRAHVTNKTKWEIVEELETDQDKPVINQISELKSKAKRLMDKNPSHVYRVRSISKSEIVKNPNEV